MNVPSATRIPWCLKPFFWHQRRKYGQPLEAARVWARRPRLFLAVANLYGALDRKRSAVPPTIRSLVTVRVSQINHCRFCVDLNSMTLAHSGQRHEMERRHDEHTREVV